jgi:hypothetical protein
MNLRAIVIFGLTLGAGIGAGASPVAATPTKPAKPAVKAPRSELGKPAPVDVSAYLDRLVVLRDDVGGYYVSPRNYADGDDSNFVFYGDAKTVGRQSVIGSGANGNDIEWTVWAPRALPNGMAEFHVKGDGTATLACSPNEADKRTLTQLPADQAKAFLAQVRFTDMPWQRQAHLLARDDQGVYYYVDRLAKDLGGKGYRVFVGMKGAMKELPMTNVVSDSASEIYATKRGELRIIAGNGGASADNKTTWHKGSKAAMDLVRLEPIENRYLIYRELGIYGQMGVLCDDQ